MSDSDDEHEEQYMNTEDELNDLRELTDEIKIMIETTHRDETNIFTSLEGSILKYKNQLKNIIDDNNTSSKNKEVAERLQSELDNMANLIDLKRNNLARGNSKRKRTRRKNVKGSKSRRKNVKGNKSRRKYKSKK